MALFCRSLLRHQAELMHHRGHIEVGMARDDLAVSEAEDVAEVDVDVSARGRNLTGRTG
jgi:hypothetical protein